MTKKLTAPENAPASLETIINQNLISFLFSMIFSGFSF